MNMPLSPTDTYTATASALCDSTVCPSAPAFCPAQPRSRNRTVSAPAILPQHGCNAAEPFACNFTDARPPARDPVSFTATPQEGRPARTRGEAGDLSSAVPLSSRAADPEPTQRVGALSAPGLAPAPFDSVREALLLFATCSMALLCTAEVRR